MEPAIFTTMCMIQNDEDCVLVQERTGPWPGLAFPGGHVEPGESFVDCVKREVWEETGLRLVNPQLRGVKQFPTDEGARYVVLLFWADRFEGTLRASNEGNVFWIRREELSRRRLSDSFENMIPVFEADGPTEVFAVRNNGVWRWETR